MRSMGAGGVLIPLVSMAASVTLLPAMLSLLGTRINRFRVVPRSVLDKRAKGGSGAWANLARVIMRRPVAILVVTSAVMLSLAIPAFGLHVTSGDNRSTPPGTEAADGLLLLEKRIGAGPLAPHQVVIDTGTPGGVTAPATVAAQRRLVAELQSDRRIESATIQAPVLVGQALARRANLIDPDGSVLQIRAAGHTDAGTQTAVDLVRRIRNTYIPRAGFPASDHVYLTGAPAFGLDFVN
jgi:RND superfamily putative drug exporter